MKLPINYRVSHWTVRKQAREQYVIEQQGKCWHCGFSLRKDTEKVKKPINNHLFPKGFFDHPVHLHHNHNTDKTIGSVHAYCNAELWQYHGE